MNRRGFTLIEILLVTALVGGISIAVANAFANGLKLWARADLLTRQTNAGVFLDKVSEDLRQVPLINTVPFKGTMLQVSFPSVVWVDADSNSSRAREERVDQIGLVQYRFDPATQVIYRAQANYAEALRRHVGPEMEVATGVQSMEIRYYLLTEKGYEIISTFDHEIPAALSIKLTVLEDGVPLSMERFCIIPVGGSL